MIFATGKSVMFLQQPPSHYQAMKTGIDRTVQIMQMQLVTLQKATETTVQRL